MTSGTLSMKGRSSRVAAAVALLAAPPALAAPVPRDVPSPVTNIGARQLETLPVDRDLRSILDLHNQVRARNGAAPLRWNPTLAANALRYAHTLAATGVLQHSPRIGRENERENIAVGPRSRISPVLMADLWVQEGRRFRPGLYPDVCTGGWSVCSHFTQMIWPTTTDVGCGYVRGRYDALVCRYSPPGNRDGVRIGSLTR